MAVGGSVLLSVPLVMVPWSWWGVLASWWPVLMPVAAGLAALVVGVLLWLRDGVKHEVSAAPMPPDRQVRPLRAWVIPAGVVLVGLVTWAAVGWLQGSVPAVGDQLERAKLRLESIRTGLTVGASVTAAFALLLAFRRQQLAERTQQATEYDAGEKRVTELYVKAADQLGAAKAPVRFAGLYALERLAQDNPAHRQSIVEVICAYLRMPYTPPDDQPTPEPEDQLPAGGPTLAAPKGATGDSDKPAVDPREERQVRLAAQRILARHLRPTTPQEKLDPSYWGPSVTLDLTEAVLIDLDFIGCHLHNVTFTDTHLIGSTRFDGATFTGDAGFDKATFTGGDASFDKATFTGGDASFSEVTFGGDAWFGEVTFGGDAWFDEVTFTGDASFREATFSGNAWFGEATFGEIAGFGEATFRSYASFREVTFSGEAGFVGATFGSDAGFDKATFSGTARFEEAMFSGTAGFDKVTFTGGDAGFDKATFSGDARFIGATFGGIAWFGEVTFGGDAGFDKATFSGDAWFGEATFGEIAGFGEATFRSYASFREVTFSGNAGFVGVTFSSDAGFDKATFRGTASFDGATLAGSTYDGPKPVAE
ncbi:pentapeptide repeat-containing protein [Micromonospora sp. NPDC003241]